MKTLKLIKNDPWLAPYKQAIEGRHNRAVEKISELTGGTGNLSDFADGYLYFGLHKENDYWVIASDHHAKDNYFNIDYTNMNFALIMGAEHAGISRSLLKLSDFVVKIPMLTNFNSLNVSNAAAIILFEMVRQEVEKNGKKK